MEGIESEGKTLAEAIESALKRLGLRRDQVEVQIIQEGSAGFMGIGVRPARVRVVEKRWGEGAAPEPGAEPRRASQPSRTSRGAPASSEPRRRPQTPAPSRAPSAHRRPEPRPRPAPVERDERPASPAEPLKPADPKAACAEALARLDELLRLMDFSEAKAAASWDPVQERVKASITGTDSERLIAQDGRPLEALQFLVTLIVGRRLGTPVAVQVDAAGYWERREGEIMEEARKAIGTVKATGKPVRLSPMDATMRRLIHRNLASDPDVTTSSEGEGSWRKIVLKPRKG